MTKNSVISITLLTLMSILTAFNAHAARQVGKITGVIPYEASGKKIVIFKIENNIAQGCNVTGRFAFDESKKNFDLMSSAALLRKRIIHFICYFSNGNKPIKALSLGR
ncbi:hypothetical protein [Vibrio cholerae]|uniref:hypothetical protein n=1 Tax=Vibrio cholerae TaxID=666 RepID=UPI0022710BE5|nr:hypothetical protein [Vibrio cholerae]